LAWQWDQQFRKGNFGKVLGQSRNWEIELLARSQMPCVLRQKASLGNVEMAHF
jgi:hypothetical protein